MSLATSIFGDQVFTATDLARRSAEVLNQARTTPITISRNDEQFALLKREAAAGLVQAVTHLNEAIDIFWAAATVAAGGQVPHALSWVTVLSRDDRRAMCDELNDLVKAAVGENSTWNSVNEAIHEWKESAAVIRSGVIKRAIQEPEERCDLPMPHDLPTHENEG